MENNSTKQNSVKIYSSNLKPCAQPDIFIEANKQLISQLFLKSGFVKKNSDIPKSEANNIAPKQEYFVGGNIEASILPFPHFVVKNFLCTVQDQKPAKYFLSQLRDYLHTLEFKEKSNDLYKFRQTEELAKKALSDSKSSGSLIGHFCTIMRSKILPWLRNLTGIPLNDEIDMFCGQYASTDCLLCHDDELEHRRFAYVYYLTPEWKISDGGSLDLFDSKATHLDLLDSLTWYEPNAVVKSVLPQENSLVVFEVSSKSFHQVSEILSTDKVRMSLTGWFHGPALPRSCRPLQPKPSLRSFIPSMNEISLSDWINPAYLLYTTQGAIQEQFAEDSEILLKDFIIMEKYDAAIQALKLLEATQVHWKLCGPANQRSYDQLILQQEFNQINNFTNNQDNVTVANAMAFLHKFINVFLSEDMFLFLSNLSGLSFHPMATDSDNSDNETQENYVPEKRRKILQHCESHSGCRYELRKWSHGNYTLVRDTDSEQNEFALDLNLFFCEKDWGEENGGYTSYIASNEAEELLTIVPTKNCLAITYRDKDALRFVKHLNHKCPETFFDLNLSYYQ